MENTKRGLGSTIIYCAFLLKIATLVRDGSTYYLFFKKNAINKPFYVICTIFEISVFLPHAIMLL